jgi:predicted nucleic acid-binding protein
MSPFIRSVIIDNDVISRLYAVGALRKVLELWSTGTFCVVEHVIVEGKRWPAEGQRLGIVLDELIGKGILSVVNLDDASEEELEIYAKMVLLGRFGKGESESIAIACHRGYDLASDDGKAKDECRRIGSSVSTFTTRRILEMAFTDGLLSRNEVDELKNRV